MIYIKKAVLGILLLFVLVLCGTIAMKILDAIFGLEYDSIGSVGFKVGFLAWVILIIGSFIFKIRKGR